MRRDIWEKPIELVLDGGDHFRSIKNCREALGALRTCWPAKRGASHAAARKSCLNAIHGAGASVDAAKAFELAAKEIGIFRC